MERAPRETLQVPTNSNNSTRPPTRRNRNAGSEMRGIPLLNTANIIPLLQMGAGPGVEDVPETSLTQMHEIPNVAGTRPRRSLLRFESSRLLQSTYEHLVDTCKTLCQQWPWVKLTSVTCPDKATLEYFIDMYFAYFHPVCLLTLGLLLKQNLIFDPRLIRFSIALRFEPVSIRGRFYSELSPLGPVTGILRGARSLLMPWWS